MVVLLVAYAALRLWRRYELVANGRRCITLGPGHFSCSAPDDVYVVDLR
jgi:hypothetical protein